MGRELYMKKSYGAAVPCRRATKGRLLSSEGACSDQYVCGANVADSIFGGKPLATGNAVIQPRSMG